MKRCEKFSEFGGKPGPPEKKKTFMVKASSRTHGKKKGEENEGPLAIHTFNETDIRGGPYLPWGGVNRKKLQKKKEVFPPFWGKKGKTAGHEEYLK